jgi:hypothetical protein
MHRSHATDTGRLVTVEAHDEAPGVLVFLHRGEEVAELCPPGLGGAGPSRSSIRWRLTFPDGPETTVVAQPGDVPIREALRCVDARLDEKRPR